MEKNTILTVTNGIQKFSFTALFIITSLLVSPWSLQERHTLICFPLRSWLVEWQNGARACARNH